MTPLLHGNIYANIHNAGFPNGEIRGQLALANGTFTDMGGNLIGVSGPGSGNMGFTSATTQTGTVGNPLNPQLGPLQNNGGPLIGAPGHTMTLQTELLLPGSPATGKGILNGAPQTDERGARVLSMAPSTWEPPARRPTPAPASATATATATTTATSVSMNWPPCCSRLAAIKRTCEVLECLQTFQRHATIWNGPSRE